MAHDSEHKSSAELQREIEAQRGRVESTIDQIQDKLSPGQLVDEMLAYAKGGGGDFVASLQRNVTANPLPVALLGVSLAWLMAKPVGAPSDQASTIRSDRHWDDSINSRRGYSVPDSDEDEDYPVTVISGDSLQRLGHTTDEHGRSHSEFTDDAGKKFKALTDKTGKRAGHFVDEAGNRYKGFTNAAGEEIKHFRDEAGNLIDEASGWASHTWQMAREKMHDARDTAGHAGDAMRSQLDSLNQTILYQFRDQPLVGGALAFALGAALGSTLPHTDAEDAVMGKASDAVKGKAGEAASEVYEGGKEKASELYAAVGDKAGELYQEAKDGATSAAKAVSSDR